ncbi:ABC1 kinase family protein [Solibacillus sp. FSL H8-0538]|uniref:ABC1 kinase family protein n=1 Tax=Solibacillus sp. FSL H8-0538 TaxID=2921400 RepID=UPI0030F863AB
MSGIPFIIQIIIVSVIIYFVSGRLIGSNINLTKRFLSVVISVSFTTFVFWYTYLRETSYLEKGLMPNVVNVATLLWIGSMLLISMLLYLFFELFDPIELNENGERMTGKRSLIKTLYSYWRQQKRLRQVLRIAVTNGITRTMKYARYRDDERELAKALRDTLEQCGGIFIKFGQVLSTRKELFSPVFIEELEKLQKNVRPLSKEQVNTILKNNLNVKVEEVFSYFNEEPLAAGSIGQVHRAILRKTNEQVVVKLLRPDVRNIMREDLSILVEFANWVSSKSQWAENLGFRELAVGFAHALREEIDFNIEARNMIQVTNVMKKSLLKVNIPRVYAEHSNANLLVMQYVEGKSVTNGDEVFEHFNIDRHEFAQTLLYSFLEQALISGIFHADPHPGNIYIDNWSGATTLLDFGAVGRLASQQQEGLKLFLVGIHQNDAGVIFDGITLLVENADEVERQEIEQAISQIMLKIAYVERIPTDELIYSLFSVVREFGLHFYPAVSVALRAIVTLDGTLRIIHENFDIFSEAKNFSNAYIKSSLKQPFKEPLATKDRIEEELAMILPNLSKLPRRIDQLFKKVESGKIILHHDIFSDKKNAMFVTQLFSRLVLLFVGITFGIISVALLAISQFMHSAYAIYLNTAAYLGLFLCAILLVRLSIQAIRDMKRTQ